MISSSLYRERGRWVIMDSLFSPSKSMYLDIKRGILVFMPRSGGNVFKIYRVVYCRPSKVYKLYFKRQDSILSGRISSSIRINIPTLAREDQTVEQYTKIYDECGIFDQEYQEMSYKIINYSNQNDHDQIADQADLENVNTRRIRIDLSKIRDIWKSIIRKIRRDRNGIENHEF